MTHSINARRARVHLEQQRANGRRVMPALASRVMTPARAWPGKNWLSGVQADRRCVRHIKRMNIQLVAERCQHAYMKFDYACRTMIRGALSRGFDFQSCPQPWRLSCLPLSKGRYDGYLNASIRRIKNRYLLSLRRQRKKREQ